MLYKYFYSAGTPAERPGLERGKTYSPGSGWAGNTRSRLMSPRTQYDYEDDFLPWAREIAKRVHILVKDPQRMSRFRQQIIAWEAEHDAAGPSSALTECQPEGRRYIRHHEAPPDLSAVLPTDLPGMYARLAAIHDKIYEDKIYERDEINPWPSSGLLQLASMRFAMLKSNVKDLQEADRARFERVLQAVEVDIASGSEGANIQPIAAAPASVESKQTQPIASYVTLDQAAAMVNRVKRTLENYADLPEPDVRGGHGKPSEWLWSRIRPWLEQKFGRQLPEHFPADRLIQCLTETDRN
jgi:hypothetical protein